MNSPFLGEEKSQVCILPISYLFSVHKEKKVSAKVERDKGIKSLNHSGMEITIINVANYN